jgi:carbonic anhydrase
MRTLPQLFENNRAWAGRIAHSDPDFFQKLSRQQSPEYLWIGCSDSRVPANVIVDLLPGELFVHRNVANVVTQTDLNCMAVVQFAVEQLRVKHIIVCGHYGCGGVRAVYGHDRLGLLIDSWLRHIHVVRQKHHDRLAAIPDLPPSVNRLCELNVIEQVANLCQTTIVRDAWHRGQPLAIHGWIYGLKDGLLTDLNVTVTAYEELPACYETALAGLKTPPTQ